MAEEEGSEPLEHPASSEEIIARYNAKIREWTDEIPGERRSQMPSILIRFHERALIFVARELAAGLAAEALAKAIADQNRLPL